MDDKEFNEFIEERIAKGILKPLSKEMIKDVLTYSGVEEETKKMYRSFLELHKQGKIEIFWNNKTNDIDMFLSRNYPHKSVIV